MSFIPILNSNTGTISYNSNKILNTWNDPQNNTNSHGNIGIVDAIYGNDTSASFGGTSFSSISSALSLVSSGQTIYILPGTYTLTTGITIPNNVSIVGCNKERVIIQMNVISTTTMITFNNNCTIENVSLILNSTGSTPNITLIGILFTNNSAQTSKLIGSSLSINNSTMNSTLTNTILGVVFNGTNELALPLLQSFQYISIIDSNINIFSNGAGNKRGILVNNTNLVTIFNTNIFMAQPTNTSSTGSYIAIETNDTNNLGTIQIRSSSIGCVVPTVGQSYTASDILQTTPTVVNNPSHLASPGIQIGPGCDLITKTAGGLGFSTFIYPTIIFFGLKGDIHTGTFGYLWPGTQQISNGNFPDSGGPPSYFKVQQQSIICGLSASLNIAPGNTYSLTLLIRCTPISTGITIDTNFTVVFSNTVKSVSFYNGSYNLNTGDLIHLYISYTGNNNNTSHDLTAEINLY